MGPAQARRPPTVVYHSSYKRESPSFPLQASNWSQRRKLDAHWAESLTDKWENTTATVLTDRASFLSENESVIVCGWMSDENRTDVNKSCSTTRLTCQQTGQDCGRRRSIEVFSFSLSLLIGSTEYRLCCALDLWCVIIFAFITQRTARRFKQRLTKAPLKRQTDAKRLNSPAFHKTHTHRGKPETDTGRKRHRSQAVTLRLLLSSSEHNRGTVSNLTQRFVAITPWYRGNAWESDLLT